MPPVRILVTGALGYMGQHLCWALTEKPGVELHGTYRTMRIHHKDKGLVLHQCDLSDTSATNRLIHQVQPQQIFHLAGNIHAGRAGNSDGTSARKDNLQATQNLYEACLRILVRPRIVFASTGAVYGQWNEIITESTPLQPLTPYAASKAAADEASNKFWVEHGLPIIRARLFNYLGSGQDESTALSRFTHQLTKLERERPATPVLRVGNLDAERDFLDIADLIRALVRLMEVGEPGEAYNVASGVSHPMHWYLGRLLEHIHLPVEIQYDAVHKHHAETQRLQVDISKLQKLTGWKPTIPLESTLASMVQASRAMP